MKKDQQLQVLVDKNFDKFIIVEKYNNLSKIICPFQKFAGQYINDINIPINRQHRIKKIQNIIPEFFSSTQILEDIVVDTCKNIDDEMFNGINDGFIMLNISMHDQNIDGQEDQYEAVYEADDILLMKNCKKKYQTMKIDLDGDKKENNFKTKGLKVLPVILYDGFMLCITTQYQSIMYVSIQHPKRKIVGTCSKSHSFKVINFYSSIWPIFDIDIKTKATVKLNLDFEFDETTPIIVKLTKKFGDNQIQIQKIFETTS